MALGSVGRNLTTNKEIGKQTLTDLMKASEQFSNTSSPSVVREVKFGYNEEMGLASIMVIADHDDGYTRHWSIDAEGDDNGNTLNLTLLGYTRTAI